MWLGGEFGRSQRSRHRIATHRERKPARQERCGQENSCRQRILVTGGRWKRGGPSHTRENAGVRKICRGRERISEGAGSVAGAGGGTAERGGGAGAGGECG